MWVSAALHRLQSLKPALLREVRKPAAWDSFGLPGRGTEAGAQQTSPGWAGRAGTPEREELCKPGLDLSWGTSCFLARPVDRGGNWLFALWPSHQDIGLCDPQAT